MKSDPVIREFCGTVKGANKHRRMNELCCLECKAADAAKFREYRARNAQKERDRNKRNRDENPVYQAQVRVNKRRQNHRHRARERDLEYEMYTEAQVIETYGTDCFICKEPIDMTLDRRIGNPDYKLSFQCDHWVPISKGGTDTLDNIRPTHAKCNTAKGSKTPEEFLLIQAEKATVLES